MNKDLNFYDEDHTKQYDNLQIATISIKSIDLDYSLNIEENNFESDENKKVDVDTRFNANGFISAWKDNCLSQGSLFRQYV